VSARKSKDKKGKEKICAKKKYRGKGKGTGFEFYNL